MVNSPYKSFNIISVNSSIKTVFNEAENEAY